MNVSQDQLLQQYQYLKSQLDQAKTQHMQINTIIQDVESSIDALDSMQKNETSMVELAAGVLLPINQKIDSAVVEIGAGTFAQVPLERAAALQKSKLERLTKNRTTIEQAIMQIQNQMNAISEQATLQQRQ